MTRIFIVFYLLLLNFSLTAQWNGSPNAISTASGGEYDPAYVVDADGSSYYCWSDTRNGRIELFAQKLDAAGTPQWQANGVRIGLVKNGDGFPFTPRAVFLDGENLIFLWHQIVSSNENYLMQVKMSKAGEIKLQETVIARGLANIVQVNGILDFGRNSKNEEILFYNRFNLISGEDQIVMNRAGVEKTLFTAQGEGSKLLFDPKEKVIHALQKKENRYTGLTFFPSETNEENFFFQPLSTDFINSSTIPNGSNSALRLDLVKGSYNEKFIGSTRNDPDGNKIILQKLNKSMHNVWGTEGIIIPTNGGFDVQFGINEDGGITAAWIEPNNKNAPMRAIRISNSGQILWDKPVFNADPSLTYFTPNKLVTNGNGGIYNLWFTPKNGGFNLSIQQLDKDGNMLWTEKGKSITDFTWYGTYRLLSDLEKGLIVLYGATKDADIGSSNYNLYTQYFGPNEESSKEKPTIQLAKTTYCLGDTLFAENTSKAIIPSLAIELQNPIPGAYLLDSSLFSHESLNIEFITSAGLNAQVVQINLVNLRKPNLSGNPSFFCEASQAITLVGSCSVGSLEWAAPANAPVAPSSTSTYTAVCKVEECASQPMNSLTLRLSKTNAEARSSKNSYREGETIFLESNGGVSYSWTGPNGFTSTSQNPRRENSTLADAGTYQVIVKNEDGCDGSARVNISMEKILSLVNPKLDLPYPNPAQNSITIPAGSWKLLDLTGRMLLQSKNHSENSIQNLSNGTYLLEYQSANGERKRTKIVVQK